MANIKEQLDSILNKEMDRKNFLQYGGAIILGAIGVTGIIRLILSNSKSDVNSSSQTKSGYGASKYGQ